MFNRKSIYALNKKDPDAIVYMDANEVIIRLTREDFASEEEFLKWKSWSDGNYHTEDNQDVVEGKHNTSIRQHFFGALLVALDGQPCADPRLAAFARRVGVTQHDVIKSVFLL